jgi:DNA-damage-inducible protein J
MAEKTRSETVMISVRLDKKLKRDAELLFSELGLNMTSAINIFLRRCLMENRIPFDVGLRIPNAVTIEAIKEIEAMERGEIPRRVLCIEEMFGPPTFDELKEKVAPIAIKHGVYSMYLFGSRARGDNNPHSDYDLCIDVPESFSLLDMGGLMADLEDAIGAKVDLLCEDDMQTEPRLMEEVLRERKLLFKA